MSPVSATEVPTDVAALRAELATFQANETSQQAQLRLLIQEERQALEQGNRTLAARFAGEIRQLERSIASTLAQIAACIAQLNAKAYPVEPNGPQVEALSASVPVALLPVRLETRWVKGAAGTELWIRIFPDQVHSDTHEPELTDQEATWGMNFWQWRWCAGGDANAEAEAWSQLATRFGAARGAWIARALRPLNPGDAPTVAVSDPSSLSPVPQFPTPASRAATWTRGAIARQLPERFLAIGYVGTLRVCAAWGAPVTPDLVTGPTPGGATTRLNGLLVDADMQWLFDFDTACAAGMGIKLSIPGGTTALDRLIVVGARPSETAANGATGFGALLTAHQYTDGFEVLLPGTPTNNGAATRSGLSGQNGSPGPVAWLAPDPLTPAAPATSHGARLVTALGIADDVMVDVAGASGGEETRAVAMLRALWPATGDYYLRQLLQGVLTDAQLATIETWVMESVRPSGALATIRVGTQPYGVIPAGSIDTWMPGAGTANPAAVKVLRAAKGVWVGSSAEVPRSGGPNGALDELLGALSMDGLSSSYAARPWEGPNYLDVLEQVGAYPSIVQKRVAALAELFTLQAPVGAASNAPRLVGGMYASRSVLLQVPLVDRDGPLERVLPPIGNYIHWLLTSHWRDIVAEHRLRPQPLDPADDDQNKDNPRYPLLFTWLRATVLIEAARAAAQLVGVSADALVDSELYDVQGVSASSIRVLQISRGGRTAGDFVWGPQATVRSPRLSVLIDALSLLASQPAAELDRLARQALDLCSHRLDAWITSLAWRRLAATRALGTAGLYVGAYGWLESLAPATPGGATVPSATPASPANSGGWIHAPSVPQATTAAILRAGERAHAGQGTGRLFEIDLSSRRAREAEWVLDGVRAGNSLAALLGYRFERLLQDSADVALPGFIPMLRALYPALAGKLTALGGDSPNAAPCVDGLALLRAQQAGTVPWSRVLAAVPGAPATALADLTAAVDTLAALTDAISDAVAAEAVHHAALGNPTRAAGSLEALDRGEAPPPELDFIRSPQASVAMTHRVAVLRAATADPLGGVAGWPAASTLPPRTAAEPVLSAIAAALLPAPSRVRFTVRLTKQGEPAAVRPLPRLERHTLAELGIGPLDVLYGSAGANGIAGSELEQRMQAFARAAHPGVAVAVDFGRVQDRSGDDISLAELEELTAALREAFAAARPLAPNDLLGAEIPTATVADAATVLARAQAALSALQALLASLNAALADPSTDDDALLGLLAPLAGFGISETLPSPGDGAVRDHARRAAAAAERRCDGAGAAIAGATPTVADVETALKALFGSGFIVLPPFTPDPANDANGDPRAPSLGNTPSLTAGSAPDVAEKFLADAASVQRTLERWQDARLLSDALRPLAARGASTSWVIAQTPVDPAGQERWVALPTLAGAAPAGGRTAWVLDTALTALDASVAGLLIDHWVDVVPQATQSTGVALNFAAPATQPPQAILVAVPPDARTTWTVEALERVIVETLDLAKVRAVDLDALRTVGHIVPGLFLAVNPAGDTISTDLRSSTLPIAPRKGGT